MARDFMQDILPQDEPPRPPRRLEISGDEVDVPSEHATTNREEEAVPERSIRNINVTRQRTFDRQMERPIESQRDRLSGRSRTVAKFLQ
jgi:hypothetical protein